MAKEQFDDIRDSVFIKPQDEMLSKLDRLQKIATKLNDDSLLSAIYERKSGIYVRLKNIDSSGVYLRRALQKRFPNDEEHRVVTYINSSGYYALSSQYNETINASNEALKLLRTINEYPPRYKLLVLSGLASAHSAIGNLDSMLYYSQEALKYIQYGGKKDKLSLYILLGLAQSEIPDYQASEKTYREVYQICIEEGFNYALPTVCINLSGSLAKQGKTEEALMFLNEALNLHSSGKSILTDEGLVTLYTNMSAMYALLNDYHKAIEMAEKTIIIAEEAAVPQRSMMLYYNLIELNRRVGKTEKSILYAKKILDIIDKNDVFFTQKAEAYGNISEMHADLGNYKEALLYRDKLIEMRDSSYAKDRLTTLQELQTKYETEKKDLALQTAALKVKASRATTVWLIALLVLLITLSALYFQFQRKKMQQQLLIIQQGQKVAELTNKTLAPNCGNDNNGNGGLSDEKSNEILRQLRDGMETQKWHKNPALTLDMLAEALNTNRSYLSIVINSRIQKGFIEYVNFYRVEEAKRLLRNTDDKIAHIATESGFGSPQTFYTTFKNFEQLTPSDYRRAAQKK